MSISTIIELVGYTGSLLVVISMLMTSITKLRVVNSLGCVIFGAYALIIHSYPTAALQACLLTINIFRLYNLSKNEKEYQISELKNGDSYIDFFLKSHYKDIEKYFPEVRSFSNNTATDEMARICIVCVGSTTAGLFLARETSKGLLEIDLDYTTPEYRDCSVGKFLYDYLRDKGITKIVAKNEVAEHINYMRKMGFKREGEIFVKTF